MPKKTSAMSEIVSLLKKDAKSPHPKYPSQSFYSVQDETVAKSLTRRFGQGAKLRDIRALEYDFHAGLNRICFEFENAGPVLGGDDLLVLLDANCAVVGLVDPFDSKQPNRMMPPLAALGGALPFVLERPSASANLPFDQADLAPQDSRAHEFMARMIGLEGWGGGGGLNEIDPCAPGAHTTMCQRCTFTTHTLHGWTGGGKGRPPAGLVSQDCGQMDSVGDDCGRDFA